MSSFPSAGAERTWRCVDHALDPLLDELSRIATSATAVDAAARFDVLLRRVGRALCGVFGVSRCWVYLTADALTFREVVAFDATSRRDARVRWAIDVTTDRVTAELVRTRAPVVVADALTDARPLASVVRRLGISDLVAVPLITDDVVIGAVYLDDQGRAHRYPPTDVAVGAALARRAAALVRQAQIVLGLRRRLDTARAERELLERTTRGQLSVDAAAIVGGCPTQLVAHVGETLDRPVLLLGPRHDLLHIAGADETFARAVRAAWRPEVFARHAANVADVLAPAPLIGLSSRQLVSAIDGAGSLVALEVGRRFDDADRRVLERAAAVLRLTRGHRPATTKAARRAPSSAGLAVTSAVAAVGLPAVIVWLGPRDDGAAHELLARVAEHADGHALVPRATGTGVVVHASSTEQILAALGSVSGRGLAVVSRVAFTAEAVVAACAEVDAVAVMLESNGVDDRTIAIDDLGAARLVLAAGTSQSVARIVEETLPPLFSAAVGTALSNVLLDTIRTLIDTDGSVREAARRLEVHENTVRYRVRRIRELTDLDLAVAGDLFQLQVALCAWEQLGFPVAPAR